MPVQLLRNNFNQEIDLMPHHWMPLYLCTFTEVYICCSYFLIILYFIVIAGDPLQTVAFISCAAKDCSLSAADVYCCCLIIYVIFHKKLFET